MTVDIGRLSVGRHIGRLSTVTRDLKIPGRDGVGRLPEVNLLNRACAQKLSTHLSAVVVSSRTPFHRLAVLSKTRVYFARFALENVPIDLIFSYIDKNVYWVHIFRDRSVEILR